MSTPHVDHSLAIEDRHSELFWAKTQPGPYSAVCGSHCIDWLGATVDGYARFKIYGSGNVFRVFRGHVFAYVTSVGVIPTEHDLSHRCQRRICVNYDHIQPLRRREHFAYDNHPSHRRSLQTHCLNGHEFTESNTGHSNGTRFCRACKAARDRIRKRRIITAGPF